MAITEKLGEQLDALLCWHDLNDDALKTLEGAMRDFYFITFVNRRLQGHDVIITLIELLHLLGQICNE